ncbi:MAG: 50S ribosomal protein L32 [Chloroflexi bacterium]|nr:50S ribosomal protein L32 [Chloroflexota bacterium]
MGAVPTKKVTRSKRGHRRSHVHLKPPTLVECPHCHKPQLAYHACPQCGYYRGREVVAVKAAKSAQS